MISQDPSPRFGHVGLAQAGAVARFQPHPEHRHHVRVADIFHGLEGPVLPRPFAPADVDEHLDRDAHSPRGVGLPDLAEPSPAEELHEPVTREDRISDGIGERDGARRAVDGYRPVGQGGGRRRGQAGIGHPSGLLILTPCHGPVSLTPSGLEPLVTAPAPASGSVT